jgi:EpsI family protein
MPLPLWSSRGRWIPAALLGLGCAVNIFFFGDRVQPVPLVQSLDTIQTEFMGLPSTPIPVSEEEQRAAGMSSFVLRRHAASEADPMVFSVYVGYYETQQQGKTIHSPRNCLPGAGWESVGFYPVTIPTPDGDAEVSRYHLVKEDQQSIVYYWYQGRGRIAYNEYLVKYDLLRDAILLGRTDEALVRIVVPVVKGDIAAADSIGVRVARELAPAVRAVVPPRG